MGMNIPCDLSIFGHTLRLYIYDSYSNCILSSSQHSAYSFICYIKNCEWFLWKVIL